MNALFTISKEQIDQINTRLQKIEDLLIDPKDSPPDWVTAKDAQSLLGVGQTTLWKYRKSGLIEASIISKKLLFKRADLIKLLSSGKTSK